MKNLLLLLFIARVAIPMGLKETYKVEKIDWQFSTEMTWCLITTEGRKLHLPKMFTVIEEQK